MAALQPLPRPGLAVFPEYIPEMPLKLSLKGHGLYEDMNIDLEDGRPLFRIHREGTNRSHRKSIFDARTGTKLFEVLKSGRGTKHYSAEVSEGGPLVFECETNTPLFGRARTTVTLANQAASDQGRPTVELELTPTSALDDGSLTWNGQTVATFEKVGMRISGEYHLTIAPGLDPTLVVGLMAVLIDQARVKALTKAGRSARRAG